MCENMNTCPILFMAPQALTFRRKVHPSINASLMLPSSNLLMSLTVSTVSPRTFTSVLPAMPAVCFSTSITPCMEVYMGCSQATCMAKLRWMAWPAWH